MQHNISSRYFLPFKWAKVGLWSRTWNQRKSKNCVWPNAVINENAMEGVDTKVLKTETGTGTGRGSNLNRNWNRSRVQPEQEPEPVEGPT
jgi:hypothetical protein